MLRINLAGKRTILRVAMILIIVLMAPTACKKKPTEPQLPSYSVTLYYRVYHWSECLRLLVGNYPVNQCGLGMHSEGFGAGDYQCKLYALTNPGQPNEIMTLVASSPLHLDRNFTCVVDSYEVYWWYWEK